MKRLIFMAIAILLASVIFTACRPAGAGTLYRIAYAEHGTCKLVSKSESDEETEIVVHDKLQDFDYKVTSYMHDIVIDGSSFGSVAQTTDSFEAELKNKVITDAKDGIDAACADGTRFEPMCGRGDIILVVYAKDADTGSRAALGCAAAVQEHNMKNRLDGMLIKVCADEGGEWFENENFGSVKLPDLKFRTPEDELADYYTEMARYQTDKDAVFLRSEKGIFSDTGADPDRVVSVLGTDFPTAPDSPVTFYYFRASDGSEYYLCDFNYYDEDYNTYAWYTSYKGNNTRR